MKWLPFFIIILLFSCKPKTTETQKPMENSASTNTLLNKWEGPYNGVPAFDKYKIEDFKSGILEAMTLDSIEIQKITEEIEE